MSGILWLLLVYKFLGPPDMYGVYIGAAVRALYVTESKPRAAVIAANDLR